MTKSARNFLCYFEGFLVFWGGLPESGQSSSRGQNSRFGWVTDRPARLAGRQWADPPLPHPASAAPVAVRPRDAVPRVAAHGAGAGAVHALPAGLRRTGATPRMHVAGVPASQPL